MAHRVLTPSSPYTQPDQYTAYPHLVTRPASPTKVPIPLPSTTGNHLQQQQQGKENNTSGYSLAITTSPYSQQQPQYSPTAPISSPKLSYTVAAAPAPHAYSRPSPTPATVLPIPSASAASNNMHYHRPTAHTQAYPTAEPTMTQLLASQPTGVGQSYASRMQDRDSTMANATGVVSWRKGQGFKEWEKVRLNSAEVKRKADVAQLCEFRAGFGAEKRLRFSRLTSRVSAHAQTSTITTSISSPTSPRANPVSPTSAPPSPNDDSPPPPPKLRGNGSRTRVASASSSANDAPSSSSISFISLPRWGRGDMARFIWRGTRRRSRSWRSRR